MSQAVRYDGVTLRLGGREWIVPPLNLRQLKALAASFERLTAAGGWLGEAEVDDVVRIVHAALTRNYPELTHDEVADALDLANAAAAIRAVAGVSGLVPVGEAGAGNGSTGTS